MNKVRRVVSQLTVMLTLFWACSNIQETSELEREPGQARRILIVYLSRTNNTKALAQIIHDQVGGRLVSLDVATPYPTNYQAAIEQVAGENARGYLPPLTNKIDSMNTYDVVFVGFPTWGMQPRRRSDAPTHQKLFAPIRSVGQDDNSFQHPCGLWCW